MDINQTGNNPDFRTIGGLIVLVVLIGARGAGKTTLLEGLRGSPDRVVLQPSTTRAPRGENDQEYEFVGDWQADRYAWSIRVGDHNYGTRLSEVEKARDQLCLTVFDPLSIGEFEKFRSKTTISVITIGLDTVFDTETQAQRVGGAVSRSMTGEQLEAARAVVLKCDVVLSGNEATVLAAANAILRIACSQGGLLVKSDMVPLIKSGVLLDNVTTNELRSASYDLSVGNQVWCQGKLFELSAESPRFDIPPYSYAIVIARETAALPTFIAGRFDIRVSLFLSGVILSNGPQVDPGYRGALFCMLFNGSSKHRPIVRGNHFSTIEFITTSRPTDPYIQQYQLNERLEKVMGEEALGGPGGTIMELIDSKTASIAARVSKVEGGNTGSLIAVASVAAALIAIPAGIFMNTMWDRVKQAEESVTKLKEAQKAAITELTSEQEKAAAAISAAAEKAIQDLTRSSRQGAAPRNVLPPARP